MISGTSIDDDAGGTWGEVGAGINTFALDSGLSGFIKGAWRFGDEVQGGSAEAGLRYIWVTRRCHAGRKAGAGLDLTSSSRCGTPQRLLVFGHGS